MNHWRDRLGFAISNSFEEDGKYFFAIMYLGTITVALQHVEDHTPFKGWSAYLYIDDAKALCDEMTARGASVTAAPAQDVLWYSGI